MSYGLNVYAPDGTLRVTSNDLLTRVLHVFTVGRTESGSRQVSGFDATRGDAIAIPYNTSDGEQPHIVTVSGDTVYYDPPDHDSDYDPRSDSYIVVVHWK